MTTFKAQLAADSSAVFLNTADFAYTLTRLIAGNEDNSDTVAAVIEYIDETSRFGDQFVTDSDESGRRHNATVLLEVAGATICSEGDLYQLPNGDSARYVKVVGEDESGAGTKTLLCRVSRGLTTKQTRVRQ